MAQIELTDKQSVAFHLATGGDKSVVVFGGSIRGGKTFWLIITFFYFALQYPKSRWVIIRRTLPDLKRNTFPSANAILDMGFRSKVESWNRDTNTITFINGSEVMFMPESFDEDKDLNRFKGLEANGIGFEEINECQEATFDKAIERAGTWLNAKGNPPIVVLATLNPAHNWVKSRFYEPFVSESLPPSWAFIRSSITDNPHIPEEYKENLRNLPPVQYARFVEGDWDVLEDVDNPFLYEWNDDLHIDNSIAFNPNIPTYISVDFNINPLCALVIQQNGRGANVVDEIQIEKGSIDAFCDVVDSLKIPSGLIRITGDAMGKGGTVQQRDNSSAYQSIKRRLRLTDSQFIIPANPTHYNSRIDCNAALRKLPIKVNGIRCKGLVYDAKQVRCDANGSIIKQNRKNISERADFLDCFRYFVNAILKRNL